MLSRIVITLNHAANAVGSLLLTPVGWLPGWLSATLIAISSGVLMLLVFKYTSNQAALKRTRAQIKAETLALSLFKDNLGVSLRCQVRLLGGAGMLLVHSLIPMALLTIPMILILGQMALWYQARPVRVGEESIVTVQLAGDAASDALDTIELGSSDAVRIVNGPVRVPSKNMVCWNVTPAREGRHALTFAIGGETYEKELVAGEGFQRTSIKRPSRSVDEMLIHPGESPLSAESPVRSIEATYPKRDAFTCGTNHWVIYWFIVSMAAAFAAKPLFKVNI